MTGSGNGAMPVLFHAERPCRAVPEQRSFAAKHMNMTEEEKQARIAEFKKIPPKVQFAALIAFALGILTFLRVIAHAYAAQLPLGKGAFYGFLLAFWFFVAGGSLYSRSRWGFLGLFALTVFPLLGLLTLSVHILRLALEGMLTVNWPKTIHCLAAVAQLVTTCVLFRYLLARQVRDYVWKPTV
jgi:hypothetical protein